MFAVGRFYGAASSAVSSASAFFWLSLSDELQAVMNKLINSNNKMVSILIFIPLPPGQLNHDQLPVCICITGQVQAYINQRVIEGQPNAIKQT
jgi:hypothetical protein